MSTRARPTEKPQPAPIPGRVRVPANEPPKDARSAAFLAQKARAFDEALAESQPRVLGNKDTEAVHDLRVALRRLRTLLKLARPVFGEFHTDAVRQSFAELQASTGDLRDEEALVETLDGLALDNASLASWRSRRIARDKRLRRSLVARLRRGELDRARAMLQALLTLPVRPGRDAALGKFARKMVQKARRGVESRRDASPDDVVGLHDLRIAYKKLRYAVEIFAEALPADLAAMAEPAARFQKRLGDLHDIDVATVTLGRARGLDVDTRLVVLAALGEVRVKKLAKYVAEMKPAEPPTTTQSTSQPAAKPA
jgi:CHAD domain-containing protein